MLRVNDWSAIRSGATITVAGLDKASAQRVRLTGCEEVRCEAGKVLAFRNARAIAELVA